MAEKGIFLDILPRFDMAATSALLQKVQGIFGKAGKEVGVKFGTEAETALRRYQAELTRAENRASQSYYRMRKAQGELQVAEAKANELRAKNIEATSARMIAAENRIADAKRKQAAEAKIYAAREAEANAARAASAEQGALVAGAGASKVKSILNGVGIAATATTAAVAFGTGKLAGEFESTGERIKVATRMPMEELKKLQDGLLQLGPTVGYTASELQEASYTVSKAGFRDAADALAILKAGAQLARTEGVGLEEAMNGLTTTLVDFHIPASQVADVASQFQYAFGNAKAPIDQLMGSLHNIEPVMKTFAGDSKDPKSFVAQVGVMLAQMTQTGASADQSSQNIRNMLLHLVSANGPQREIAGLLGVDMDALSKQLKDPEIGPLGVMKQINDAIKKDMGPDGNVILPAMYESSQLAENMAFTYQQLTAEGKAFADAIQNGTLSAKDMKNLRLQEKLEPALKDWDAMHQKINSINPILKKNQDQVQTYASLVKKITGTDQGMTVFSSLFGDEKTTEKTLKLWKDAREAHADANGDVEHASEVMETYRAKLDATHSALHSLGIQLGDTFLPYIKGMADGLRNVAQWLGEHEKLTGALIKTVAGLAGAWITVKVAVAGVRTIQAIAGAISFITGTAIPAVNMLASAYLGIVPAAGKGAAAVTASAATQTAALGGVTTAARTAATAVSGIGFAALAAIPSLIALSSAIFMAEQAKQNGHAFGGNSNDPNLHREYTVDQAAGFQLPEGVPAAGSTEAEEAISAAAVGGDAGAKWVASATSKGDQAMRYGWLMTHGGLGVVGFQAPTDYTAPRPGDWNSQVAGGGNGPHGGRGMQLADERYKPPASPVDLQLQAAMEAAGISPDALDGLATGDGSPSTGLFPGMTGGGSDGTVKLPDAPVLPVDTSVPGGVPGMPEDPSVYSAESSYINDRHKLAEKRARVTQLEQSGVATEDDIQKARNDALDAERDFHQSELRLNEARKDQYEKFTKDAQKFGKDFDLDKSTNGAGGFWAQMGQKIAGAFSEILFGGLLGPLIKSKFAELDDQNVPYFGMNMNGGYRGGYGGGYLPYLNYGGYPGDDALLSRVPAGKYTQEQRGDLTQGLADCSSAVEDLVNIMDGRPTGGANMWTGNADQWLTEHGFVKGMGGPGDFRVGFNSSHMQATLPGGTPFNWGSDAAAARRGIGGTGADDPAFTSHYYRPAGGTIPLSPAAPDYASTVRQSTAAVKEHNTEVAKGQDQGENLMQVPQPTQADINAAAAQGTGLTNPGAPAFTLEDLQKEFAGGGGGEGPIFKRSPQVSAEGGTGGPPQPMRPLPLITHTPDATGQYGSGNASRQRRGLPIVPPAGMGIGIPGIGAPGQAPGQVGPFPTPNGINGPTLPGGPGAPPGAPPGVPGGQTPKPPPGASGAATPGAARPQSSTGGQQPSGSSGGGGGLGFTPGGAIDMAGQAAAAAANAFAPGSGIAVQKGMEVANRAMKFGGQLIGIGAEGLMETFLLNDSPLADPSKSWFGKVAMGIGNIKPAGENTAGQTTPPLKPEENPQQHQGNGQPPGPLVNIEQQHIAKGDGGEAARDTARMFNQYQGGGAR
ncbi:tape measure protein [Mycobacterium phage Traaww1]|nr:tape measure protein [Mycobacterium phage Traaww1]